MITDAMLSFVPLGGNLSIVAGVGVDTPSPNVIDLLGYGVGVAPANSIWGTTTVFGQADAMGVGGMRPELNVSVGTAFSATGGTGTATLNVALQGAPDPGAAGNYTPASGDWQTFVESGELTIAQLVANAIIFRCPWLPPFPANLRPRFLRLLFQVPAAVAFGVGTIASALVTTVRDDQFNKYQPKNYVVS